MEKLFKLIEQLEESVDLLEGDIKEYNEMFEEEGYLDVQDMSGGNFDDAYDMGLRHGEMFKEYHLTKKIVKQLNEILELN